MTEPHQDPRHPSVPEWVVNQRQAAEGRPATGEPDAGADEAAASAEQGPDRDDAATGAGIDEEETGR